MKPLEKGQRVILYELMSDGGYTSLKKHGWKGKQAIGEIHSRGRMLKLHFLDCSPHIPRNSEQHVFMFSSEVKLIGTFVVKKVYGNNNPCTII